MIQRAELPEGRVLIVLAHPDDETIACGGEMPRWPDCVIAHTTGGSPGNLNDARLAGFESQQAYGEARRRELGCALAEVGGRELRCLGFTDQDSWRNMAALTHAALDLVDDVRPAAIITHPYEGGHPDHDAAAFAVQMACGMRANPPARWEAAFYNRVNGVFRTGEFLTGFAGAIWLGELSGEAAARKQRMLNCFASQQGILRLFGTRFEPYREAPEYDFTRPPHEGLLNYETLGWGITSKLWLEAAAQARSAIT